MHQIQPKRRKAVPDVAEALLRGDLGAARRGVGRMLDAGDMTAVAAALDAAACGGKAAADFEHHLERAAQRISAGGWETALFCIPAFADPLSMRPLPAAAVASLLAGTRGASESFALLDGWLDTDALMRMQATDYRALVRRLGPTATPGGALVSDPPVQALAGFPAGPGMAGGVAVRAGGGAVRRVGVRYVLGVAVRPSNRAERAGLFADLVDGGAGRALLERIEGALAPAGDALSVARPGMPIWVGAGSAASLDCIALEARMEGIATQVGRTPIVHFAIDADALHVVVTRDGAAVLDAFRLCRSGMDGDEVFGILRRTSRGLVDHADPSALPACPPMALN